ncbi:serine/threonine-protein kinase Nek2 [Eucalyptus grandis]|uniref:serine/threonine-protein kinase Nek2 n=1 Tax=Eucalyptus grandis TaxID=71139 RepID=UPI00192EB169|nr:serine/threonine-protein kinase Nek2 [Eucalyptus grandis]
MRALINKINKSIVAPLPTMYTGALRGLIKSMLRKNPELRPSAAELLNHPHLQPYVLKVHLKLNSPRRSTYPMEWCQSNYMKKIRFVQPEPVSISLDREKRWSFSNDRTLNPSISGTEHDSFYSMRRARNFSIITDKFAELSVDHSSEEDVIFDSKFAKLPSIAKSPRLNPAKTTAAPRKQSTLSKTSHVAPKREVSRTPRNTSQPSRRVPLPLSATSVASATPYRTSAGFLHRIQSPDVSVNAPRIDKIAEFPLTSPEDSLLPIPRNSSTSPQCSSASPETVRSITKDKCTVQILDKAHHAKHNREVDVASHSSFELWQHRFDTSSYRQRAEALEGLLEFSARLLQQQRFDELGVLLKPFGPEKVSPRETAIWLAKSFKDTTVK